MPYVRTTHSSTKASNKPQSQLSCMQNFEPAFQPTIHQLIADGDRNPLEMITGPGTNLMPARMYQLADIVNQPLLIAFDDDDSDHGGIIIQHPCGIPGPTAIEHIVDQGGLNRFLRQTTRMLTTLSEEWVRDVEFNWLPLYESILSHATYLPCSVTECLEGVPTVLPRTQYHGALRLENIRWDSYGRQYYFCYARENFLASAHFDLVELMLSIVETTLVDTGHNGSVTPASQNFFSTRVHKAFSTLKNNYFHHNLFLIILANRMIMLPPDDVDGRAKVAATMDAIWTMDWSGWCGRMEPSGSIA